MNRAANYCKISYQKCDFTLKVGFQPFPRFFNFYAFISRISFIHTHIHNLTNFEVHTDLFICNLFNYSASNSEYMDRECVQRMMKWRGSRKYRLWTNVSWLATSYCLCWGTAPTSENHEKLHSGYPISEPIIESMIQQKF